MPVNTNTGTLHLNIKNIRSLKGCLRIAVFQGKDNFLVEGKELAVRKIEPITGEEQQLRFPDLSFGTYAIAIYHDENNNGKLDKNVLGIPSEPYSFSNNPKIKWKGPTYELAQFNFEKDETVLDLELRTWSKQ